MITLAAGGPRAGSPSIPESLGAVTGPELANGPEQAK